MTHLESRRRRRSADGASANNTCQGTLSDDGEHYNFSIDGEIRDCGTEVSSNGTHISFSNSIHGTAGEIIGKITRQRVMNVQFECQFDKVQQVHLSDPITANLFQVTLDNGEELAEFEVSFGIYEDQTFSSFLPSDTTTNVPNDLFLGVSLDASPPDYAIQIEECWATPSADVNDAMKYHFMENFCPVASEFDIGVVEVYDNGVDDFASLRLESFVFENSTEAFFHCAVQMCDTNAGSCVSNCAARRRRRSKEENERILLTVGISGE